METVFCDLLSTHTHTPFDVLALAGVSGDMLFLVCDDLPASIDGFKADLEENGATVRITNHHQMFCEEHYSTY